MIPLLMEWTNDFTLEFLELYRQEVCLWDREHPHYKRKEKLNEAWKRLSTSVGKPVTELKRKKDSLMATFRGHLRRKKKSIRNGDVGSQIYQPIWFAFDFMLSFLGEMYDYSGTTPNKDVIKQEKHSSSSDDCDDFSDDGEFLNLSVPEQLQSINNTANFRETSSISGKSKRDSNNSEDECDLYGKIMAKKLRKLPEYEREVLMHNIDGMIIKAMHSQQPQAVHHPSRCKEEPAQID